MTKTIIFGGSGFLGSHVADSLSEHGHQVTIFDRERSPFLRSDQKMIEGNILDTDAIKEAIKGKDYVLNFAGVADLNDSKNNPIGAAQANIIGNLNLLEAIKVSPPKRFIFASTYYVYSESGSIYRVTKQSSELFIEEYARLHNIKYSILRYGSLYGTRANEKNGVYKLLKDALIKRKIERPGDGEVLRDYIHVKDAADATCQILEDGEMENKCLILAGHQSTKIKDLTDMVIEMIGEDVQVNYLGDVDQENYRMTPYTFKPKMAQRYLKKTYYDLGQGLLEVLEEIYKEREENETTSP